MSRHNRVGLKNKGLGFSLQHFSRPHEGSRGNLEVGFLVETINRGCIKGYGGIGVARSCSRRVHVP